MRSAEQWLSEYGETHRNPTNKKIHFVCVPAIMFSVFGLLWAIPVPAVMAQVPFLNWTTLFIIFSVGFYASLGFVHALKMMLMAGVMVGLLYWMDRAQLPILWISVGIFVVAWIGQFIGHSIEGRKPSFFTDLQFLLIGPLWVFQKH